MLANADELYETCRI